MTQQVVMTAELMTLRDDTTRCDDNLRLMTAELMTQHVVITAELMTLRDEIFDNKKRLPKKPFSVPRVGIEPTCPRTHDFESCASTNSAI